VGHGADVVIKTFTASGALKTGITVNDPATVAQGGTGLAALAQGDLIFGSALDTYSSLAKTSVGLQFLSNQGDADNDPGWFPVTGSLADLAVNGVTGFFSNLSDLALMKTRNMGTAFLDGENANRNIGMAFPTATGASSSSIQDTRGNWRQQVTGTTAGSTAGWRSANTLVRLDHNPYLISRIRTNTDITALRFFMGWFSADPVNADTQTTKCVGLRFSTVAGDAGFTPISSDGTTQNTGTTMGTMQASTEYLLAIRVNGGGTDADFSVINRSGWVLTQQNLALRSGSLGTALTAYPFFIITTNTTAKKCDISRMLYDTGLLA
jgi:hypothetical protein